MAKLTGNLYLGRALTLELLPAQQETHPTDHRSLADPDQEKAVLLCKQGDQAPLKAKTTALGYVPYQCRCRFVVSGARQILTISDPTEIFPTSYVILFLIPVPMHDTWPAAGGLQAKPSLALHKQWNTTLLGLNSREYRRRQHLLHYQVIHCPEVPVATCISKLPLLLAF